MDHLEPYDVYAVRYATNSVESRDNFLFDPSKVGADPHESPMPLDFFVWAIVGGDRTWIVDLGFEHEGAARRGRAITRLPSEGLQTLGIDSRDVEDVIVSHLHYDHAGDLSSFPNARLHIQESELAYATGRI